MKEKEATKPGTCNNDGGFHAMYMVNSFWLLPSKITVFQDAIFIPVSLFFSRGSSEILCEEELNGRKHDSIKYR
jgi:hypothetical protein